MARYFGIFLGLEMTTIVLFSLMGTIGMTDYLDGIVITVGMIVSFQLSVIICLLIYIIDLLKRRK